MLLEFQERIVMVEEWWSFAQKGARGRDGMEIKSMIDLAMVKRDMLRYVQDVRAVRGDWTRPLRPPCCTVQIQVGRSMD